MNTPIKLDISILTHTFCFHYSLYFRGQSFLPAIPGHRVEILEDRLSNQEKTTTILLDQAFKIKEDASMLRGNRGQHWDMMAQRLLENHMQTVIQIIKQLSRDIEVQHCSLNVHN